MRDAAMASTFSFAARRLFPISRKTCSASRLDQLSSTSSVCIPAPARFAATRRARTHPGPSLPSALTGSPMTTVVTSFSRHSRMSRFTSALSDSMARVSRGELMIRAGSERASPTRRVPRSTPRTLPTYCPVAGLYVLPCFAKIAAITSSVMSISCIRYRMISLYAPSLRRTSA